MIESHEGENEVVLDTPAGIVRTKAMVKDGKVESVTLTNVPAFVYLENQTVTIDGKEIHFTISFGGSFFALVDSEQLDIRTDQCKDSSCIYNTWYENTERSQ